MESMLERKGIRLFFLLYVKYNFIEKASREYHSCTKERNKIVNCDDDYFF